MMMKMTTSMADMTLLITQQIMIITRTRRRGILRNISNRKRMSNTHWNKSKNKRIIKLANNLKLSTSHQVFSLSVYSSYLDSYSEVKSITEENVDRRSTNTKNPCSTKIPSLAACT
jgi:hypothetical protein